MDKIRFVKDPDNPVIPVVPNTWKDTCTANPDILEMDGKYFMYYRGRSGGHDRMGLMTQDVATFTSKGWKEYANNPIIDVSPAGVFDSRDILDPATVKVGDTIYLYYTAHSIEDTHGTGLALTTDGYHFKKYGTEPVIHHYAAPEIVYKDGTFFLFCVDCRQQQYKVSLATSQDGFIFGEPMLVFEGPTGEAWEKYSVTTQRIFEENGMYFMIYAADDTHTDFPKHFGLAYSRDLVNWTRYEHNPIFTRGDEGQWDDGGMWFGCVLKHGDTYYMWYEGYGGSYEGREVAYGRGGVSQIGLATYAGKGFEQLAQS